MAGMGLQLTLILDDEIIVPRHPLIGQLIQSVHDLSTFNAEMRMHRIRQIHDRQRLSSSTSIRLPDGLVCRRRYARISSAATTTTTIQLLFYDWPTQYLHLDVIATPSISVVDVRTTPTPRESTYTKRRRPRALKKERPIYWTVKTRAGCLNIPIEPGLCTEKTITPKNRMGIEV